MARKTTLVGQTKAVGFQIGVRKTFAITPTEAWRLITSPTVVDRWLGPGAAIQWEKGTCYTTTDGTAGEIRVVNQGSHFRLTWQPSGWAQPSMVQVRVIPHGEKTVISFHQENLAGPAERTLMQQRWQAVLEDLETLLYQRLS